MSSNSVPNSKTTSKSNSIKQKLCRLPKTFQLFGCLHRKKTEQGLNEEKEAKNHTEAEKLD